MLRAYTNWASPNIDHVTSKWKMLQSSIFHEKNAKWLVCNCKAEFSKLQSGIFFCKSGANSEISIVKNKNRQGFPSRSKRGLPGISLLDGDSPQ